MTLRQAERRARERSRNKPGTTFYVVRDPGDEAPAGSDYWDADAADLDTFFAGLEPLAAFENGERAI